MDVLRSDTLAAARWSRRSSASSPAGRTRFAVACSSGTAGLTWRSTAWGSRRATRWSRRASRSSPRPTHPARARDAGLRRIDAATLNLDPAAVEAAITPRTKAILPVHIFGYPAASRRSTDRRTATGSPSSRTPARRSGARSGAVRGDAREPRGVRLLPEQAADDGRGRDDHHRRRGRRARPAQPRQPGPLRQRRLARPPADRLQPADGRDVGGHRRSPQLEKLDALLEAPGGGGRALRRRGLAGIEGVELPVQGAGGSELVHLLRAARGRGSIATRSRPGLAAARHRPRGPTCRPSISSRPTASGSGSPRACCPSPSA